MAPKLYRAAEVCEMTQLQSYVLRSWEKEFPGIGVQKSADSVRLYRQSDVDQVLRIKQLVFGEGLTLSGARRRLEEDSGETNGATVLVDEMLGAGVRQKLKTVKNGLESILQLLSKDEEQGELRLVPPPPPAAPKKKPVAKAKAKK